MIPLMSRYVESFRSVFCTHIPFSMLSVQEPGTNYKWSTLVAETWHCLLLSCNFVWFLEEHCQHTIFEKHKKMRIIFYMLLLLDGNAFFQLSRGYKAADQLSTKSISTVCLLSKPCCHTATWNLTDLWHMWSGSKPYVFYQDSDPNKSWEWSSLQPHDPVSDLSQSPG